MPPYQRVERYRPLAESFSSVIGSSLSITDIEAASPQSSEPIIALRERPSRDLDDLHAIALTSRCRSSVLLFDANARLQGTASAPFKTGDLQEAGHPACLIKPIRWFNLARSREAGSRSRCSVRVQPGQSEWKP